MYKIELGKNVHKDLARISRDVAATIKLKVYNDLASNPRGSETKSLKGEKYKKVWRYRVADYRVLYEIHEDKKVIIIARILHRSKLY